MEDLVLFCYSSLEIKFNNQNFMKKLLIGLILLNFISCSDDCEAEKTRINEYYDNLVVLAVGDSAHIKEINDARELELRKACD